MHNLPAQVQVCLSGSSSELGRICLAMKSSMTWRHNPASRVKNGAYRATKPVFAAKQEHISIGLLAAMTGLIVRVELPGGFLTPPEASLPACLAHGRDRLAPQIRLQ